MVPRTGVEPVISGMKAQRPRPLDERGWYLEVTTDLHIIAKT